MKKLINILNIFLIVSFWSFSVNAQRPFITIWKTNNPGTSDSTSITIPTSSNAIYNYDIDWNNDGVYDNFGVAGDITHDFGIAGEYTIKIKGTFPRIFFNDEGDKEKILEVVQWGDIAWTSMYYTFAGCNNLSITATDLPDLSNVTSMNSMFRYAKNFNSNINSWDVSNITDMRYLFCHAESFNQPLNNWNVSNVENMEEMFYSAKSFNKNINDWDVSNVTSMEEMFSGGYYEYDMAFNQPLDKWDVSKVTNMKKMFYHAVVFNKDINNWKVDSVKTIKGMFTNAQSFNQPLDKWNVSNVTDMGHLFFKASSFNQDISMWDVSNVENMFGMFAYATSFNKKLNTWKVNKVKDMAWMFREAAAFNQPLNLWKLDSIESMFSMFAYASSFNQPLHNWKFEKVNDLESMFYNASSFNQDLNSWDVSDVTNFNSMFNNASSFNQHLGYWDISSATDMDYMLGYCVMDVDNYDYTLKRWANQNVQNGVTLGAKSLKYCNNEYSRNILLSKGWTIEGDSKNCAINDFVITCKTDNQGTSSNTSFTIQTFPGESYDYDIDWDNDGYFDQFGVKGDTVYNYLTTGEYTIRIRGIFPRIFYNGGGDAKKLIDVKQWGDNAWTSMAMAFSGCSNLNFSASDTPYLDNVIDMSFMFANATSFNSSLGNWDVSGIENMEAMFYNAESFNKSIKYWYVANVKNMSSMFYHAISFNQQLNEWDLDSLVTTKNMFAFAESFNQPLNDWNTANISDMSFMFYEATSFNKPLDKWNVSNVTDMIGMFYDSKKFNQNLNSWNVSNVQNMSVMFFNTIHFNQNFEDWDISNVVSMSSMLSNSGLDVLNYDKTLISWSAQPHQDDIDLGVDGLKYCDGQINRANMVADGWIIDGDAIDCNDAFVTLWKTDNNGSSNSNSITIPTNPNQIYNYDVDWNNDGIYEETGLTGSVTHDFGDSDYYTIRIKGDFPQIYFNNTGDKEKLLNIVQWGGISWESMKSSFWGCRYLTLTANDQPDLSNVENMTNMFAGAELFNSNINDWNVSNITNLKSMFNGAISFNQPLDKWDVLGVNNMTSLFENASSFNQALASWEVDSVNNMSQMFFEAEAFDQNVNSWDVSNILDMHGMFYHASSFNQPVNSWEISKVQDMSYMFTGAESFNQAVDSLDVSGVTKMDDIFLYAELFNQDLSNWDMSNVTSLSNVLSYSGLDVYNFDKTLVGWAKQALKSNQNVGFIGLKYCNGENARDSLVSEFGWTINGDSKECSNAFVTIWKVESGSTSVTIPTYSGALYDYDIDWDNDGVYDDLNVKDDITHDYFSQGTYKVRIKGSFPMIYFFETGESDKILSVNQWGDIHWQSMKDAFMWCDNINISASDEPDLSNVTDMSGMFYGTTKFNSNIDSWDVSNVENMEYLFAGATSFNQPLDNWNVENVKNMTNMFSNAKSFNQPLNNWEVKNVLNMDFMFTDATSFNQPLNNWDVSKVENMYAMFRNATSFNQELNLWKVNKVTDMASMFGNAISFNKPLNNWDVQNVVDMDGMFYEATSFDQNLGYWDIKSVKDMDDMLSLTNLSTSNYDKTLKGWEQKIVKPNVILGVENLKYCSSETARNSLISQGWQISGDSKECTLSIELRDFEAKLIDNSSVELIWSTLSEINNKGFSILKSKDGVNWEIIDFIDGNGNSSKINNYSYTDESPFIDINYYRLEQIDFDGRTNYSDIVSVKLPQHDNYVSVYPNPSSGLFNISIDNYHKQQGKITIIDNLGNTIWQEKILGYSSFVQKQPRIVNNGIYYIGIQIGNRVITKKLIIANK